MKYFGGRALSGSGGWESGCRRSSGIGGDAGASMYFQFKTNDFILTELSCFHANLNYLCIASDQANSS